jgi:hypothetical protein
MITVYSLKTRMFVWCVHRNQHELKKKLLFTGVKPWLRKEIFRSSVCIKDDVKKEKRGVELVAISPIG